MQSAIESYEVRLEELDKEVDQTEQYVDLLSKYGTHYGREDVIKFWFLKVMPMEVKRDSNKGGKLAQKHETMFLNKLDEEKAQFQIELKKLEQQFEWIRRLKDYQTWRGAEEKNFELNNQIKIALQKKINFNNREALFNIELTPYENLLDLEEKNEPYKDMRDVAFEYESGKSRWKGGNLVKVKYSKVASSIDQWSKKINSLRRRFEADEDAEEALEICRSIKEDIDEFKKLTPMIRELTREAVVKNPVYWTEIFETLGEVKIPQAQATLTALLRQTDIVKNFGKIEEICVRADKEYSLRIRFNDVVMKALNDCTLELISHKNSGTHILGDTLPLQQLFDDQFNAIVMMKQNPFIKPIRHEVELIEKKLIAFQDMFDSWIKCQRGWIYLEPIFSSDEMKNELPVEKEYFVQVDKKWREIMELMIEDPLIF